MVSSIFYYSILFICDLIKIKLIHYIENFIFYQLSGKCPQFLPATNTLILPIIILQVLLII